MSIELIKDPEQAAKAIYELLKKEADNLGADPANITLMSPEDGVKAGTGSLWRIMWEEGPEQWGSLLSMGVSMYDANREEVAMLLDKPIPPGEPQVGISDYWYLEPYYSFDVGIVPV